MSAGPFQPAQGPTPADLAVLLSGLQKPDQELMQAIKACAQAGASAAAAEPQNAERLGNAAAYFAQAYAALHPQPKSAPNPGGLP